MTLIINLLLNFFNLLSLLWKSEFEKKEIVFNLIIHEFYMNVNVKLDKEINVTILNRYLWLLNSKIFRKWVTSNLNVKFLKLFDAARFISFILKLIQLKRTSII